MTKNSHEIDAPDHSEVLDRHDTYLWILQGEIEATRQRVDSMAAEGRWDATADGVPYATRYRRVWDALVAAADAMQAAEDAIVAARARLAGEP
jgi:hypothetical protein